MANNFKIGGIKEGEQSSASINQCCQDVFRCIISDDKFEELCAVLQGTPTGFCNKGLQATMPTVIDGGLNFQLVATRMVGGVYGKAPELFYADMQQIWKNIQCVGKELIFLADVLSQRFVKLYKEQVGYFPAGIESDVPDGEPNSERGFNSQVRQKTQIDLGSPVHQTVDYSLQSPRAVKGARKSGARMHRFNSLKGPQILLGAEERACRICGLMEGTDCLTCSSCNAGYHPYCLEPPLSSLPQTDWSCPTCALKQHDKGNSELQPSCEARVVLFGGAHDLLLVGEEKEEHVDQSIGKVNNGCLTVINDDYSCKICEKDDDQVLVCDSCESAYHMYCLTPALDRIPEEDWYCPLCVENEKTPFLSHSLLEMQHAIEGPLSEEPLHHCAVCERIDDYKLKYLENGSVENKFVSMGLKKNCTICKLDKGGEYIITCDACPKAYHFCCLKPPLISAPQTTWFCPSCLCRICKTDTDDNKILLCDACDEGYHTYCLSPPLVKIPKGKWFCPSCSIYQKTAARARSLKERRASLVSYSSEEREPLKRKRRNIELPN